MFRNTFQSGFLSIFYSLGSKPLQLWSQQVRNLPETFLWDISIGFHCGSLFRRWTVVISSGLPIRMSRVWYSKFLVLMSGKLSWMCCTAFVLSGLLLCYRKSISGPLYIVRVERVAKLVENGSVIKKT